MSIHKPDSKPTLTFLEVQIICEEWVNKLQLEGLPIFFDYIEQPYNKKTFQKGIVLWDEEEKAWHIELYELIDKRAIIHELGHIYFAKILNDWYFVASCKVSKQRFRKMNYEITRYFNRLLDCFVDYHLTKFEGFYDAFVTYISSDLKEYPDPQRYD